jgi:uncharacterized protein (DUF2235 family)
MNPTEPEGIMNRKLALFFDGTWNSLGSDTNVCRLYEMTQAQRRFRGRMGKPAQKEGEPRTGAVTQIKYYHAGVGVNWGEKLRGGMFGCGISRNIKDG